MHEYEECIAVMRRRRAAPLLALRAFEASASVLSFTLAAETLNVTQSAISRHVKHLEDVVGMRLFERRARALTLTPAGEALLPRLTRAFDLVDDALRDLRAFTAPPPVIIGMPPTFAIRLGWDAIVRFQSGHPDAEIHVRVVTEGAGDRGNEADITVEFLDEAEASRLHRLLFLERLVLVCGAELARAFSGRSIADSLAQVPLLHVAQKTDTHVDWRMWLEGAGVGAVRYSRGLVFATADMAIQATLKGAGASVMDLMYVEPMIQAGLLAMPHPYVHASPRGYYVSLRDGTRASDATRVLWQWLLDGNWKRGDDGQQ